MGALLVCVLANVHPLSLQMVGENPPSGIQFTLSSSAIPSGKLVVLKKHQGVPSTLLSHQMQPASCNYEVKIGFRGKKLAQ